jgi:hydroxypyruvate reductase/glycerate 2-kinase
MAQTGDVINKIIDDALAAVDPVRLIRDNIHIDGHRLFIKHHPLDLNSFNNIHIIGVGKAAPFLFEGLNQVLGNRITGGVVVSLPAHAFQHPKVKSLAGSHPVPDQSSLKAGQGVIKYIEKNIRKGDLVFFLITGGASALMVQPIKGLTLKDKMALNQLLLASGADISEINCVRKNLSALKGGKLAQLVHPARLISLVLSDVIDSPLGDIGSGPSINQTLRKDDAYYVLKKYELIDKLPAAIKEHFSDMPRSGIIEKLPSLSETHPGLDENVHFLLADNYLALESARRTAENMGLDARILTSRDKGEAGEAAKIYAAIIKEIMYTKTPFKPPVLLLCGGELTVTLKSRQQSGENNEKGGRNQALVLHLLKELKTISHPYYIASVGTDGIDGPTDAAGAWIDQHTFDRVRRMDLDIDYFLETFDSYRFFDKIDQLIKTGPTRTNVMDLRIFYIPAR